MKKRFRVQLRRTQGEWDSLYEIIGHTHTEWGKFWRRSISILREEYRQHPESVTKGEGALQTRTLELSESQFQLLEEISNRMKKPIPSIINELILSPTLRKSQ